MSWYLRADRTLVVDPHGTTEPPAKLLGDGRTIPERIFSPESLEAIATGAPLPMAVTKPLVQKGKR